MIIRIEDADDPRIEAYRDIRERDLKGRAGAFVLEGEIVLKAALKAGRFAIQSLLIGTILLIMAFLSVISGIVSDLIRTNRTLIEDTLEHTKKMRFGRGAELPQRPLEVIEREAEPTTVWR